MNNKEIDIRINELRELIRDREFKILHIRLEIEYQNGMIEGLNLGRARED